MCFLTSDLFSVWSSIIAKFDKVKAFALRPPEDTKEMMQQIEVMEKFQAEELPALKQRIGAAQKTMLYLVEEAPLAAEDAANNAAMLACPAEMTPVLDDYEILLARRLVAGENGLDYNREKCSIEIEL